MKKLKLFLITLVTGLFTSPVMAVLPTAADVTGGAVVDEDSPIAMLQNLFSSGIGTAATVFAAFIILGGGWHIWNSFAESREKGNWKNFAITFSVVAFLMVGGVVLAILANNYGGTFA